MRTAAHHQKTIEILSQFWSGTLPLDRCLKESFRQARYMGSSDRRTIFQLIYDLMRHRQRYLEAGATHVRHEVMLFLLDHHMCLEKLITLWDGASFHPASLSFDEKKLCQAFLHNSPQVPHVTANVPLWIYNKLSLTPEAWFSLNQPAPVDLWVNPEKSDPVELAINLRKQGYDFNPVPGVPYALRGDKALQLDQTLWYQQGYFEFQDAGSQKICQSLPLDFKGRILDLCAGAGGKTLNLAAQASPEVEIIATDKEAHRLKRAAYRLQKADLHHRVRLVPYETWDQQGPFEGILIDAPCSGSGTWRRCLEGRWTSNEEKLKDFTAIQQTLLLKASRHLKPGGWLAYVTCSLFQEENQDVIENFLANNSTFHQQSYDHLTPWADKTDGFFISILLS